MSFIKGEPPPSVDGRKRETSLVAQLKANPGKWWHHGEKSYRGGWNSYKEAGFQVAVRSTGRGTWDHYLMWPGNDE